MVPTSTTTHSRKQRTRRCQRAPQLTTLKALSVLVLPTLANSVSLSQFQPSIDPTTLTPSCSAIYTSTLPSCTAPDFSGRCSSGCINALIALYSPIYDACGTNAKDNQLLIGNFLAGNGLTTLCKGVDVVTLSPTSAMTAAASRSRAASSQVASSQVASATQYQSMAPLAFPAYGSSVVPLSSSSSSTFRSHPTSTLTTEVTSTIHSTHTEQTVHPYTSNTSRTSPSPTSTMTGDAPMRTQTTAAQYSHCVEYESNPFKNCGEDQGSGAVALRTSLWRIGGLMLIGVLGRVVVIRGSL